MVIGRLVDVYFDGRILATCPVSYRFASGETSVNREALIRAARRMLADDGVLTEEQLSMAAFSIRRES